MPPPVSLALASSALQQHYASSLRSGLPLSLRRPSKQPSAPSASAKAACAPPSSAAAALGLARAPSPSAPALQAPQDTRWECEGCGRLQPHAAPACAGCGALRAAGACAASRAPPPPATLAQRLGLVPAPAPPPSPSAWAALEALAASRARRGGRSAAAGGLDCAICRAPCGLRDAVLTSCAHAFHAACLGSLERYAAAAAAARCCPLCRALGYAATATRMPARLHITACATLLQRVVRGWAVRSRMFALRWGELQAGGRLKGGRGLLARALARATAHELSSSSGGGSGGGGRGAGARAREAREALAGADAALAASAAAGAAAAAAMAARLARTAASAAATAALAPFLLPAALKPVPAAAAAVGVLPVAAPPHTHTSTLLDALAARLQARRQALCGVADSVAAAAHAAGLALAPQGREGGAPLRPAAPPPPLTPQHWQAVKARALRMQEGEGGGRECCVCLAGAAWGEGHCTLLSCAHVLHTACLEACEGIAAASGAGRRCPLCREGYRTLRLEREWV